MSDEKRPAPGHPGIAARWTSSAKSGIGTAITTRSRVWFTLSHGILNEVYYPRVDQANIRDMGLLVTGPGDFFSEEKRNAKSVVHLLSTGVPAYRLVNTCVDGRYRIEKTIICDPEADVVLQQTRFYAQRGQRRDYKLYVLLAPHLGNQGAGNSGWTGSYKGMPALFAQRGSNALALACSTPFAAASCGYVGSSDGWQQLHRTHHLDEYDSAPDGNIALTGEIDVEACDGEFVLALAFGAGAADAGQAARAALLKTFDAARDAYIDGWKRFHAESRAPADVTDEEKTQFRLSIAVLRAHEDKGHRGGTIASLSVPWGSSRGDHDLGGYHVVWPRDLVEGAGALLAAGHTECARDALHFLIVTQEPDGHWPQNMWLDGSPNWNGIQLDETAFPILLADHLRRRRALGDLDPWPMVSRAASYLVRNGPVTPEDRWEEDGGYSTFTLAVEIAALIVAAEFADAAGADAAARYLRDTADSWSDSLERWTYVTDTALARRVGVDGYYVRIAPGNVLDGEPRSSRDIRIKNQPNGSIEVPYSEIVSPDALALVRFGVRRAEDERIVNTVRVIDHVLRQETPTGPIWHRYNDDGYGEHDDGSPFDGSGRGRGWPLLAGERAHYELAVGNEEFARRLLGVMQRQSSSGGLIPEQVWDADDIPARELRTGCPSGSAMPLVWAHAEYVKLARSLHDGRVYDMPPKVAKRYAAKTRPRCDFSTWRFNNKRRVVERGRTLRIEMLAPAIVRWSCDGSKSTREMEARDTTLGVWVAELPTDTLDAGALIEFTFCWTEVNRWEEQSYSVRVTDPEGGATPG